MSYYVRNRLLGTQPNSFGMNQISSEFYPTLQITYINRFRRQNPTTLLEGVNSNFLIQLIPTGIQRSSIEFIGILYSLGSEKPLFRGSRIEKIQKTQGTQKISKKDFSVPQFRNSDSDLLIIEYLRKGGNYRQLLIKPNIRGEKRELINGTLKNRGFLTLDEILEKS